MFKKHNRGNTAFYTLPSNRSLRVIRRYDEFEGPKEIAKYLNDPEFYDISAFGNEHFRHFVESKEPPPDLEHLPAGTYKYFPFDNPESPDRFEVFPTRKEETYIKLPEIDILKNDLNVFLGAKDLYKELGFAYRRGYLLHGRPGNGKTALIRSLLNDELLKDAQIIWLPHIPHDAMIQALNATDSLKVVIFEEIIDKYNNVNFSLSELLNFMDGENSIKNCITIATTNYPEHLGENLANRPSRFDVVLEFKDPTDESVYMVMEKLLKRDVREEFKNRNFSFAQVKEIVLLHRMHGISLEAAAKKLDSQTKQFKRGFEEAKNFGFGVDNE